MNRKIDIYYCDDIFNDKHYTIRCVTGGVNYVEIITKQSNATVDNQTFDNLYFAIQEYKKSSLLLMCKLLEISKYYDRSNIDF